MSFEKDLYHLKKDEYYDQERQEMLAFVPSDVEFVLDVGCSSGGFGRMLKEKRNCRVWGVEPTDSAVVAEKWLDKVYHDIFHPALDFGDAKFDAIIFNDVLEHLVNPWEALQLARSLLRKNGWVIASIPNIQCYSVLKPLILKGDWNYTASGIMDKTHLRFFTGNSMTNLFRDTGFDISKMEGQNSILSGSRFLRLLHWFAPKKIDPFTFVNYAICAQRN
ncbi:MAG TPA: class I SAM-dependent methyltransferase [Puia sp.]|nr:class I SAM-dependent methyltransferase [Puia sp.]